MKLAYLAFSETGYELAKTIANALGGDVTRSGCADESGKVLGLKEWTKNHFSSCDAIVFVGAMGIAVRAIAPFVKDKKTDPAIIVIDDKALHVIPVLSGHLGGANDLARQIAEITGSDPVITTATDINGVFAVDEWSKRQNCIIPDTSKIVEVSGKLLHDVKVSVYSPWPISGEQPEGVLVTDFPATADVVVDFHKHSGNSNALYLIPAICTLGIGCRKGTPADTIEAQFKAFADESGIYEESIKQVATIDLKKDEPGLIDFCNKHGWPLITYSGDELNKVQGEFSTSEFVSSVTGVDNVCERSAVLASSNQTEQGTLKIKKYAGNGVTLALAASEYKPDWTWQKK